MAKIPGMYATLSTNRYSFKYLLYEGYQARNHEEKSRHGFMLS